VLVKKQRGVRRAPREVLETLSEALKEIEAHFEMMGFSRHKGDVFQGDAPKPGPEDGKHEEPYEDDYGEDEDEGRVAAFQREEIEVAIDVFISSLVQENVIRKYPRNKQPSLENVFEKIFGENHEIIKPVQVFEEHIEGYFDLIGYEDMEIAFAELTDIRDIIDKEIESYAAQ
jgi:hypothetical protein